MAAHLERVARRERLAQQWAQSWLDTQSKAPGINLGEMEQSLAGMLLRWGAQYAKDESAAALAACAREAMTRWRDQWRKEALEMVDPHYAKRGLHQKYLKLDNMAAGIDACADDLEDWLTALERAVGEGQG